MGREEQEDAGALWTAKAGGCGELHLRRGQDLNGELESPAENRWFKRFSVKGLLTDVGMGIREAQRVLRPQTPAAAGSHHYLLSQGGHSVTKSPLKVKAARKRLLGRT